MSEFNPSKWMLLNIHVVKWISKIHLHSYLGWVGMAKLFLASTLPSIYEHDGYEFVTSPYALTSLL